MRNPISSDNAPAPAGTYSSGIIHNGVLYLAGQGPFDSTGQRVGDSFAAQARQTFDNLQAHAHAAGTDLKNALRYGVYLKNLDDFEELNEIAHEYFIEPFPVRTTISVELRGFDIEIDAILEIPT